ncbi:tetratricopeptide repeat protein (plasmid) [Azospirillum baldaniorum]|uniref:Tetratricopeptide TPR_2 repeat protein n=1 Tax=Azospirillum baldaniorum TaxID=1064539 RepID=A0A9P1JXV5_9PROT|nr:tetratricopeptide repeat protein [Azospirillum baldaniorum]AWJ93736.1 tetratricopeptide repeat protein [Azospirillum baldaniorum]TWA68808.1 Ca-activated chloride channel family protein [Azospirillum brasilense]CCD01858.1 tetratricopeptide TPR_2 repeat protein [Azospirillum baldaniorum]
MRNAVVGLLAIVLLSLAGATLLLGWKDLWATPDQRGRWLMERGRYAEAADAFIDPMWRGVALMKAGNFKDAAPQFAGIDTAEAAYDQGNALVMQGKYDDAVARYDRALALRPGWADAEANRTLARLRADRVRAKGGDDGDTEDDPDDVVYDRTKKDGGKDTETSGGAPMSDEAIRALWLKRVQTQPADFLRARFAYQLQAAPGAGTAPGGSP